MSLRSYLKLWISLLDLLTHLYHSRLPCGFCTDGEKLTEVPWEGTLRKLDFASVEGLLL